MPADSSGPVILHAKIPYYTQVHLIYVTIQVVILMRDLQLDLLSLVYLQTTCINGIVYTFGEIFVTIYALMLTPSMPTRWDLTATLQ